MNLFTEEKCCEDLNGAFIPQDKEASDNLSKTQVNIRKRFNLESKERKEE